MRRNIIAGIIVVDILVLALVVVVAMQPSEFRVTRTTTISAPPAAVFAQVNDFHNWQTWSPWAKLDPAMQQNYEGESVGVGSVYSWSGNSKVGAGRMTLVESHPDDTIKIKLEFLKPFATTNATEFTFEPSGNQTAVTWSMTGKNTFMMKAFSLVMNMDKTVGGDFEKGLAQMKAIVEGTIKP